jgi:hypothetical protein
VPSVRTLINVAIIFGLFTCAYLVAWWLIRWLGADDFSSEISDALDHGYENDAIPEWEYIPTDAEWREWQQMLDDEAQDGEDHR